MSQDFLCLISGCIELNVAGKQKGKWRVMSRNLITGQYGKKKIKQISRLRDVDTIVKIIFVRKLIMA